MHCIWTARWTDRMMQTSDNVHTSKHNTIILHFFSKVLAQFHRPLQTQVEYKDKTAKLQNISRRGQEVEHDSACTKCVTCAV